MGSSNSKDERVYVYSAGVPLNVTPQLAKSINKNANNAGSEEGSSEAQQSSNTSSSIKSGFASSSSLNSRNLADAVEEEVSKELSRILEKNQYEELQSKERQASTTELLNEIRDITQQISSSPTSKSQTFTRSIQARDRVTSCLKDNSERPLNCWKEVSDFKNLVATLESEFVAASK
ncbi:hypothetical protein GGI25_006044 [Coemansia spiralis]|uniref:Uncharacterized protein n=2 Tax=Coemansia TaxID=4863 RepID=A0A9W8G164_9FUNG|nr:hypothetical protein BX070DRAFT_255143 [Coemansia spiralis]KAJ1988177.1 hypothetical protein EDC05_005442 [Coemansia umbellata]KAJ2619787.1 hypothetical protein GGI26_005549 [Coemansia sp. RSA 1358]KAJ2669757.1 hypothetical protein GGI25_006044 [Coemansia spiralis]